MSKQRSSKLNLLLKYWPPNAVYTTKELKKKGISRNLVHSYQQDGWLEKIGNGAYSRPSDNIEWSSGLSAVQSQLKLEIYLGGKSALAHQGFSHFIPLGKNYPLYLYGEKKYRLPTWFKKYNWGVKIQYINTCLFKNCENEGLTTIIENGINVQSSTPERAIMELLYLVPKRQSYEEAEQIMGTLTALKPVLVQRLLEKCTSIKVKRLFMLMAREYNYPWFKKIDSAKINFGKGKRLIIKGGFLDPEYQITIPKNRSDDYIEV